MIGDMTFEMIFEMMVVVCKYRCESIQKKGEELIVDMTLNKNIEVECNCKFEYVGKT